MPVFPGDSPQEGAKTKPGREQWRFFRVFIAHVLMICLQIILLMGIAPIPTLPGGFFLPLAWVFSARFRSAAVTRHQADNRFASNRS